MRAVVIYTFLLSIFPLAPSSAETNYIKLLQPGSQIHVELDRGFVMSHDNKPHSYIVLEVRPPSISPEEANLRATRLHGKVEADFARSRAYIRIIAARVPGGPTIRVDGEIYDNASDLGLPASIVRTARGYTYYPYISRHPRNEKNSQAR